MIYPISFLSYRSFSKLITWARSEEETETDPELIVFFCLERGAKKRSRENPSLIFVRKTQNLIKVFKQTMKKNLWFEILLFLDDDSPFWHFCGKFHTSTFCGIFLHIEIIIKRINKLAIKSTSFPVSKILASSSFRFSSSFVVISYFVIEGVPLDILLVLLDTNFQ